MPTNSVSDVLKILGKLAPGQAYFVSFCIEWYVINSNPTTYLVAPPTLLQTPTLLQIRWTVITMFHRQTVNQRTCNYY